VKQLSVSFLWHMHQPNYLDPIRGYFIMPWVRLHATKAYLDMPKLAESFPGMGLTFNLVPSLLEQIDDYINGGVDYELMLSRKDPVELTSEDKEAILTRFFQASTETMIKPLPRYMELLQYRGAVGTITDIRNALGKFAAQDYLDLQVLFNLAWFGFSAREDPDIRKIIRKGRLFTIEERDFILDRQIEVLGELVELYGRLWKDGVVDLTASPFYHPILPLLCDTNAASEGMPGCLLPKRPFREPGDAARQVNMALDYFEKRLGRRPDGMWPSEGSVSPEALDIIRDAGIKWIATDEAILARSVKGFVRDRDLFQPWSAHGLTVFFRDHGLSDQIGFVYSRNPVDLAVDDFVNRLKGIAAISDARHVSVILDGENPWGYYPNSGREFLESLYGRLLKEKAIRPVAFSEYLAENPPGRTIDAIFPGSWINGNFDTWMGDQEEADGWDALGNARDALAAAEKGLEDTARDEAWKEIHRAEGSDWFWWYGEDHTSPNDPEFDRLFRANLKRVYTLIGEALPDEVVQPIIRKQTVRADAEPTGLISPVIDGRVTTFYEWLSAGWIPTSGPAGAMSGNESMFTGIYYGFDLDTLYLRMDLIQREEPLNLTGWRVTVDIDDGERYRVELDLGNPVVYTLLRRSKDRWIRRFVRDKVSVGRVVELGVPFKDISVRTGEKVGFVVMVYEQGVEKERYPFSGRISLIVPDKDYQSRMWQV